MRDSGRLTKSLCYQRVGMKRWVLWLPLQEPQKNPWVSLAEREIANSESVDTPENQTNVNSEHVNDVTFAPSNDYQSINIIDNNKQITDNKLAHALLTELNQLTQEYPHQKKFGVDWLALILNTTTGAILALAKGILRDRVNVFKTPNTWLGSKPGNTQLKH